MSVRALAWVQQFSPMTGTVLDVHLAVADSVNDDVGGVVDVIPTSLTTRCRLSDRTVKRGLQALVDADPPLLVELPQFDKRIFRYRFCYPTLPVLHEPPTLEKLDEDPRPVNGVEARLPSTNGTKALRADLFDALIAGCGWDAGSLTTDSRGRLNSAVKQLVDAGVHPAHIQPAVGRYRQMFPNAAVTPQALTKNWPSVKPAGPVLVVADEQCPLCFKQFEADNPPAECDIGLTEGCPLQ